MTLGDTLRGARDRSLPAARSTQVAANDVAPSGTPAWPSRHLPSLRLAAGVALAWSALGLRWLSPVLHAGIGPGAVPLAVTGPLAWTHASFALPLAACAAVALLATARAGGVASATTRACGLCLIALVVLFVLDVRVADLRTLHVLQSDNAQYQTISNEFGYESAVYAPPTSFLGFRFDSTTTLLLSGLGGGWYAALLAGVLLGSWHRAPGMRRRRPSGTRRLVTVAAAGVAVAAIAPLVAALVAQQERVAGIAAMGAGEPALARAHLDLALRLDPTVVEDQSLDLTLGQAQAALGDERSALALYAQAMSPSGDEVTTLRKLQLLGEAQRESPSNDVIAASLGDLVVNATEYGHVPVDLPGDRGDLVLPEVAYTLGHYAYKDGDEQGAERYMRLLLSEGENTEVRSFALTYLALAEQRLGDEVGFRRDIIAALHADPLQENPFAEEISAGLYEPGTP